MKSQALALINRWSWFQYLPVEAKVSLAEQCRLISLDKGAVLYCHNEKVTHIYGVVSGSYRIYVAASGGEEMTLEEVAPGAWFPQFLPQPSPTYFGHCTVSKAGTLVALPRADFLAAGEQWPQLYRGLYNEFVARGAVTIGRLELLTIHSLHVRLAVYLLRLLVIRGRTEADGSYLIESTDSQGEIANRVGGARQRVNSILKEWERQAVIRIERDSLLIREPLVLAQIARDSGFDLDGYLRAWQGGWKSPFEPESDFSV